MYRQYGWTWDSSQKRDTWQVCNFFSTLISFSLEHFHCLFKIWTFASKFAYCYGHPKLIFTVTLRILTVKKTPSNKIKIHEKVWISKFPIKLLFLGSTNGLHWFSRKLPGSSKWIVAGDVFVLYSLFLLT